MSPDGRSYRITTAPEDARDAPPSWNPSGGLLTYASDMSGDRRTRVFVVEARSGATPSSLQLGRDPAWHPSQNRIVYNGFNDAGGDPGLWLMDSEGGDRSQLTDNGNDLRPTWSPDGRHVVFMSTRDGNWELYRVSVADGSILRLTDDPAQDGLPTISPDGKWVAFASDRDGYWRLWVVPFDGGEALPLFTLSGVLTSWLEHAIQWLP